MSYFDEKHAAQVISASLAATSFVGFTQIVSRGTVPSGQLEWAIILFAVGLPLLTAIACAQISTREQIERANRLRPIIYSVWLLPVAAIGCMFASYGQTFWIAYVVSIIFALGIFTKLSGKPSGKS